MNQAAQTGTAEKPRVCSMQQFKEAYFPETVRQEKEAVPVDPKTLGKQLAQQSLETIRTRLSQQQLAM